MGIHPISFFLLTLVQISQCSSISVDLHKLRFFGDKMPNDVEQYKKEIVNLWLQNQ